MKTPSLSRFVVALVSTCLLGTALAQSSTFAVLNKELRGQQTGPATAQPAATGAYGFSANIDGTPTTPAGPINFVIPAGGGTRTLNFDASEQQWEFQASFNTQAELTAAFPNGTYPFTFGGRTVSLPFTGDLYPSLPVATVSGGTWNNGTLSVNRTQPLTITINFPQNYVAGSARLGINLFGGPNGPNAPVNLEADTSNGFNQQQLTLTVPANTLAAGGSYTVELEANRIVTLDSTSAPGYTAVAVYSAASSFTLVTGVTGPPTFSQQPANQQISSNSTVVFSAASPNATSFQWRKNGTPLTGETRSSLVIFGATSTDAGAYSVLASNADGSTPSLNANLTIAIGNDFGRLSNLSILTDLTATTTDFTLGTVIGGANTTGDKPLLVRAVGPSLNQLIGTGALIDSKLELFAGQGLAGSNDDWAGAPALVAAFAQVGAFPFISNTSKDAAIFTTLTAREGGYTVRVSGAAGATGRVIAELYDATPSIAFRAPTPRLINVSVRKQIDTGTSLTAGFVIGGSTAKTVLVRAIGPGLAVFGVPGLMADPRLQLFNAISTQIAANDNWGGDAQLSAAGTRVGAFDIANRQGADAMLLITLTPGNYTAEVRGATTGGVALVEVYEVP